MKITNYLDCGCAIADTGKRYWCPSCLNQNHVQPNSPMMMCSNIVSISIKNETWSDGPPTPTALEVSMADKTLRFSCIDESHAIQFLRAIETAIEKHTVESIKR